MGPTGDPAGVAGVVFSNSLVIKLLYIYIYIHTCIYVCMYVCMYASI